MKNTLLTLAVALVAICSAQAQDYYPTTTPTSEFKPVAGDRSVEAGSNLNFGNYYYRGANLKYRKFTSDNNAFRIGLSAYFDNTKPNDDIAATNGVTKIIPGFERHFAGTNRLSPYIGADFPLSVALSRYEDQSRIE